MRTALNSGIPPVLVLSGLWEASLGNSPEKAQFFGASLSRAGGTDRVFPDLVEPYFN